MASDKVMELTDEIFTDTIQDAGMPVLVDFWAEWCAPCRRMTPIVDEVAQEFDGKLKVCKVNIDDHQGSANQYGVMSIPTMMIFKDGEVAERITGAVPKEDLIEAINRTL